MNAVDDGVFPQPCPICTGHAEAVPCSDECDELVLRNKTLGMVKGAYEAAWKALFLARLYLAEGGNTDARYRACLDQAGAYRRFVRLLRNILKSQAEDMARASTIPAPAEAAE